MYQDQDAILYWLALVWVMSQFYDILANAKALGVAPVQRKISLREKNEWYKISNNGTKTFVPLFSGTKCQNQKSLFGHPSSIRYRQYILKI